MGDDVHGGWWEGGGGLFVEATARAGDFAGRTMLPEATVSSCCSRSIACGAMHTTSADGSSSCTSVAYEHISGQTPPITPEVFSYMTTCARHQGTM